MREDRTMAVATPGPLEGDASPPETYGPPVAGPAAPFQADHLSSAAAAPTMASAGAGRSESVLGRLAFAPEGLALTAAILLWAVGRRAPEASVASGYAVTFGPIFLLVSLVCAPWWIVREGGAGGVRRTALALTFMASVLVFQPCFAAFKSLIGSSVYPFRWDPFLASLDRSLHGGVDPWRLLAPLIARQDATRWLELFYSPGWILLTALMVSFAAWHPRGELRFRFMAAYVLVWTVGGAFLAVLGSSAGPLYYGLVVPGRDPFAPLVAHVQAASPFFATVRAALWAGHEGRGVAYGISAWPSIHLATSTLYACAGWAVSRAIGAALTVVLLAMAIGSVALGWHYAVDSYAGIALGLGGWVLAGRLARMPLRRGARR